MVSISEVHILIRLILKIISTKNFYKQKPGQLDEKTAKNIYLYAVFCPKTPFKVEKSFIDRSAWSKHFLRSEKISSHCNFFDSRPKHGLKD